LIHTALSTLTQQRTRLIRAKRGFQAGG